ncbi:MAG: TonB-dependent receptor [Desulfamplus sp.]|nr:TonB-dependent receptor [Desulfamplus sp.]
MYKYIFFPVSIFILSNVALLPSFGATRVEKLAELSIEQLTSIKASSTSFFDIPPEKTPASLHIIPGERIARSSASSISDFLEYHVPGVHISRAFNPGTLYSTRGIASSSNASTLFMLDGSGINASNGAGINTNLDLPLLGYIDSIEVLKGPCSMIHGSGSINGFVNVIPRSGRSSPGSFINTELGFPHDLVKWETGHGITSESYGDIFVYAGMLFSGGVQEGSLSLHAFNWPNTRFSVNWQKSDFKVNAFFQHENIDSKLHFMDSFQDKGKISMENSGILPEADFHLTDTEMLNIAMPVLHLGYDPDYMVPKQSRMESEWQVKPRLLLKTTRFERHQIAMGASVFMKRFSADAFLLEINTGDEEPPDGYEVVNNSVFLPFELDFQWLEAGLFFEDHFRLTDHISIFSGLRYEKLVSHDLALRWGDLHAEIETGNLSATTSRCGIVWDVDGDQNFTFIYQEGYHFPSFMDILTYGDRFIPLTVEDVASFEMGYQRYWMDGKSSLKLNVYHNLFDNTAFYIIEEEEEEEEEEEHKNMTEGGPGDNNPALDDGNDSRAVRQMEVTENFAAVGFEAALNIGFDSGSWLELSYGFARPYDIDSSDFFHRLVDRSRKHWRVYPEHMVKFNAGKTFLDDKLDLTLGVLYASPVKTLENDAVSSEIHGSAPGIKSMEPERDIFDDHRLVFHAALEYHFTEHCSVTFKGKNIFNNDVPAASYYYESLNRLGLSLEEPLYTIGIQWKF